MENGKIGIRAMSEIIQGKKERGEKVFDFTLGNPGLEPVPGVREALSGQAEDCNAGYAPSLGEPGTRDSLAGHYSRKYSLDLGRDCIGISSGATGALNLIFGSIGEDGDNIIFPVPLFDPPYNHWAARQGKSAKKASCNGDFSLDVERIGNAVDERTCGIYINPRNNPTGKMYSEGEMADLISLCRKRGIYLIVDSVYEGMEWKNGSRNMHFEYENAIEINSLSKRFSLAGARVGWFALHPGIKNRKEIMEKARDNQQASGIVCPNMLSNAIPELLMIPEEEITGHLKGYEKRVDSLVHGLAGIGYDAKKPDSTFYVWFHVPECYRDDDMKFVSEALEIGNIAAVGGSVFGGEGYVRLSVGKIGVPEIGESMDGFERLYRGR